MKDMELTASQEEHEVALYRKSDCGWEEFGRGWGTAAKGATRDDVMQGLTEFLQEALRDSNVPREERPLLHQVMAVAVVPPFDEIAVNGFGVEMVRE